MAEKKEGDSPFPERDTNAEIRKKAELISGKLKVAMRHAERQPVTDKKILLMGIEQALDEFLNDLEEYAKKERPN